MGRIESLGFRSVQKRAKKKETICNETGNLVIESDNTAEKVRCLFIRRCEKGGRADDTNVSGEGGYYLTEGKEMRTRSRLRSYDLCMKNTVGGNYN